MPVFSPNQCRTLLLHTAPCDLPGGITMRRSTNLTAGCDILAGRVRIANVYRAAFDGAPSWQVDWNMRSREAEITELLRRIVAATETRLAKDKADGLAVLDSLALTN